MSVVADAVVVAELNGTYGCGEDGQGEFWIDLLESHVTVSGVSW